MADTRDVTRQRLVIPLVAVVLVLGAFVVSLALPMYSCAEPYEYEYIEGPGAGPVCIIYDMGYRPRSWLPTKITVAGAGVMAALAVLLWRRRRSAAVGLLVGFAVLAAGWFVLYGEEGWLDR